MGSKTPISFIATDDPAAASRFYTNVLSLTLVEQSSFALVFLDIDHMLRVQIVEDFSPASHTAYGWRVEDIRDEIAHLVKNGVEILRFDHLPQDEFGCWITPDNNKIAWFKDPAGNILSLTEFASI